MSYLNSVTIIGFVGADPEQRQARNNNGSKSPFCPSRRSGRGRTPTTNGRQRPSGIACALYGIRREVNLRLQSKHRSGPLVHRHAKAVVVSLSS